MSLLIYIRNNANQINRKNKEEIKKNRTEKQSRNPIGTFSNFTNKSIKGNQMSSEDIEIKAKKLMIYSHDKEEKKTMYEPSISIFAGFRTTKGFNPKRADKINQDRILITPKFNNANNQWLFWVFDGHGTDGHEVSQYICDNISAYILKQK